MIIEIPKALTQEECSFVREAVAPFLLNAEQNTYNRDGKTVNITRTSELKNVDNFLSNFLKNIYEKTIFHRFHPMNEFLSGDSGYEYHLYGPNEVCNYHADGELHDNSGETLLRYASVTLHLNTVHNGGELIFPTQNKSIKTEEGKVVVFPPYGMFGHYTTPSQEPREVIVTWFVYKNIIVRRV